MKMDIYIMMELNIGRLERERERERERGTQQEAGNKNINITSQTPSHAGSGQWTASSHLLVTLHFVPMQRVLWISIRISEIQPQFSNVGILNNENWRLCKQNPFFAQFQGRLWPFGYVGWYHCIGSFTALSLTNDTI